MSAELYHRAVMGRTRSGKTFWTLEQAKTWPGPVLYWNPQHQDEPGLAGWVEADASNRVATLFRLPRARVNYIPDWDDKLALKELRVIVRYLLNRENPWPYPVLVILDEVDLIAAQGKVSTPAHHLTKRGAKKNVWAWVISQFPADVSKTMLRQCRDHRIFAVSGAVAYYEGQKMPGVEIEAGLNSAPRYSHMRWLDGELSGPIKPGR